MRVLTQPIPYGDALEQFRQYAETVPGILFESVDIAPIHGRKSLYIIDPIVELIGKGSVYALQALQSSGELLLNQIGELPKVEQSQEMIRYVLKQLAGSDPYFGLYGMFAYDFVRQFEVLPSTHAEGTTPDFHLYIPDVIVVFDHFAHTAELRYYQFTDEPLEARLRRIPKQVQSLEFTVGEMQASMQEAEYVEQVHKAQEHMRVGDIFELLLSRKFSAKFQGSALGLYQAYREANPSPYLFYLRTLAGAGGPQRVLVGASPEMFVRVEQGVVMTRPISGTAPRQADAVSDFEQMLELLNSSKERSELDMLIDLARNDLARVCKPGITVSDYRFVEKYSKVMHTVAQVTGELDTEHYTAFDALVSCLNAGTLTGAPKIRAMELIEELEQSRRGLYGGCVGYLTFNNELNTGITIRSAVIEQGKVTTQAGATLLLDSQPTAEFAETEHKAAALLGVLKQHV